MEFGLILIIIGLVVGFYMAWSIGANDVANAMGTSVGSGALTLKQAVMLAAVLEFAGAFLVGSHVTQTVRKGIIDPAIFAEAPIMLVCGMLAALLAAAVWLQLASYFGWPVSTTHSIVGSIVGFGAVYGGLGAVHWGVLGRIVSSWVISPVLSAAVAYIIFTLIMRLIFYAPYPLRAAQRATPVLVFAVFFVMTLVTVYKGLKNVQWLHLNGLEAVGVAAGIGAVTAAIGYALVRRRNKKAGVALAGEGSTQYRLRGLEKAAIHLRRVEHASAATASDELGGMITRLREMADETRAANPTDEAGLRSEYRDVERVFIFLQILSASFVAFAHGSNDVANAIGPLSAVIETVQQGSVAMQPHVAWWVLALGGAGIVVGLATWGWRVIQTIGRQITELTPSRGFAAEFAAATTIVIASRFQMPISTTHTLVGAVLGVGLARGIGALNLYTVRDIVASWIITIPAGAGLAILFFYALAMIFA